MMHHGSKTGLTTNTTVWFIFIQLLITHKALFKQL